MRKLITIICILFCLQSSAQVYQLMPQYGYQAPRMAFDSTLQIPTTCGAPTLKSVQFVTKKGAIAFDSCNNRFYTYNPKTQTWSQVSGGGGSTDTTSLSNRINLKIDSVKRRSDSVFAYRNGTEIFQFKDSVNSIPTINQVLAVGNTATNKNMTLYNSTYGNSVDFVSNAVVPYIQISSNYTNVNSLYLSSTNGPSGDYPLLTFTNNTFIQELKGGNSTGIINMPFSANAVDTLATLSDLRGVGNTDTSKVVIAKVHNATGTILYRGEVVYLSGANGDVASVKRANNKQDSTSSKTFGIVRRDIAVNDTGYITTQGQIEKLNLGSFTAGDIVYLDSIDGQLTKTMPVAPYNSVFIGVVERANNGNGLMYVKPQNGYEISELHDVQMNGKLNNQILVYSDTQKIWKNRSVYSVVDTTSLSSRINTKLSTTDTSYLQQKSLPAYSIAGNGTYQQANAQSIYYKDTSGTYTGTITFTATTAPSGTTNHSYRWTRIGNLVNLNITLVYSVAGGTVSQVILTLPSDAPTPAKPAGLTSASNTTYPVLYQYSGNISSQPGNAGQRAVMRTNAANNGSEIVSINTGTTITVFYYTVQYTAQ